MSKIAKRPTILMPTAKEDKAITAAANIEPDASVPKPEDFLKVGTKRHWDREPKVRDLA